MKYIIVDITEFNERFVDKKLINSKLALAIGSLTNELEQLTNNITPNALATTAKTITSIQTAVNTYVNKIDSVYDNIFKGVAILEVGFRNKIKVIESKNDVSKSSLEKKVDGKRYSERLCEKFGLNPVDTFEDLDGAKLFVEINGTK